MIPLQERIQQFVSSREARLTLAGIAAVGMVGCARDSKPPTLQTQSGPVNELVLPGFSLDTDVVRDRNMVQANSVIREKAKSFPSVTLLPLTTISKESSMVDVPPLVSEERFKENGIRSIALARDATTGFMVFYIALFDNVRFGDSFSDPRGTPWPGFIFAVDKDVNRDMHIAAAAGYSVEWRDSAEEELSLIARWRNPLKSITMTFPSNQNDLAGRDFVLHLNAGLLKVGEEDRRSFTMPLRFSFLPNPSQLQVPVRIT